MLWINGAQTCFEYNSNFHFNLISDKLKHQSRKESKQTDHFPHFQHVGSRQNRLIKKKKKTEEEKMVEHAGQSRVKLVTNRTQIGFL